MQRFITTKSKLAVNTTSLRLNLFKQYSDQKVAPTINMNAKNTSPIKEESSFKLENILSRLMNKKIIETPPPSIQVPPKMSQSQPLNHDITPPIEPVQKVLN
jgi:hypothetical protein